MVIHDLIWGYPHWGNLHFIPRLLSWVWWLALPSQPSWQHCLARQASHRRGRCSLESGSEKKIIPSGKLTVCYGKSPSLIGKSTIMTMFNSHVKLPEATWTWNAKNVWKTKISKWFDSSLTCGSHCSQLRAGLWLVYAMSLRRPIEDRRIHGLVILLILLSTLWTLEVTDHEIPTSSFSKCDHVCFLHQGTPQ